MSPIPHLIPTFLLPLLASHGVADTFADNVVRILDVDNAISSVITSSV
jgi:hypothetical protein